MTNIDFHSLSPAKRCCLAHATAWRKEKSALYPPAGHPFGHIVSVPEIAGASLFAARQVSLSQQSLSQQSLSQQSLSQQSLSQQSLSQQSLARQRSLKLLNSEEGLSRR